MNATKTKPSFLDTFSVDHMKPSTNGHKPAAPAVDEKPRQDEGDKPLRRIRFIDNKALRAMECPPIEWIIPDVLPVGLVSAIVAQSGAGKSWCVGDMMRKLSYGGVWAGKYQLQKRKVGYIDLEGNYTTLQNRMNKLDVGAPNELDDEADANLWWSSDLGQLDLTDEAVRSEVIEAVKEAGIEVLFVDSLSKTHLVDENTEAMKHVMNALEDIARRASCTIVVIHHAGKDKTRGARGSSAIKAAMQHQIELIGGESEEGLAKGVKIALTKAKSSPLIPFIATFSLEPVVNEAGKEIGVKAVYTSEDVTRKMGGADKKPTKTETIKTFILTRCNLNVRPAKTRAQVANMLMKNELQVMYDGKDFEPARDTVYRAINEMIDAGSLTEADGHLRLANVSTGEQLPMEAE